MLSKTIQTKLERLVKKYLSKHPDIKLVVVAGSVGKTTTKVAIATVLSQSFRVRLHEGNHNSEISAPLAILGIDYPDNIRSISAWINIFRAAKERIKSPTDVDVIIQELGSDRIGQIAHYRKYLYPDLGVVTAISPEHMEFFETMDNVAKEEMGVANYSKEALINRDDIDGKYAKYLTNANVSTYGTSAAAEYHFISQDFTVDTGYKGQFIASDLDNPIDASVRIVGEHSLRTAVAAFTVGVKMGMESKSIAKGLAAITAVPGRMNILRGIKNSVLIDDTYNSSPLAIRSSLQTLYQMVAPQRIAVLGSMNELGASSADEHKRAGELCNPNELAWVITVGDEAEKYLAPAAKANGCQVKSFKTAVAAGGFVRGAIEDDAVVLFKGSQGGIYTEEAVKVVLHTAADEAKLVRQSPAWIKTKTDFFSNLSQAQPKSCAQLLDLPLFDRLFFCYTDEV